MESIILQLLRHNMFEQKSMDNLKRKTKGDKTYDLRTELEATFSEKQKQLFDEFIKWDDEGWAYEVDCAYECGFKTGGRLAIEMYHLDL